MKLLYVGLVLALAALPAVSAVPALCGTDCRIAASSVPGYDPVVAHLAAGSSVTWFSTDVQHFTRDGPTGMGCFFADHPGQEDSLPVRFDIADGALTATTEGETLTCTNAVGNAAGGFVLQYFCVLHPTMRAALVVTG